MEDKRLITCVYCGHEYSDQTPTSGAKILEDHIKICVKHPMREAEQKIDLLRKALIGLVGASEKEELIAMEKNITDYLREVHGFDVDHVATNAIHVLLETM